MLAGVLLALLGVIVILGGLFVSFAGGMSDAPAEGQSVAHKGCMGSLFGILILVVAITIIIKATGN